MRKQMITGLFFALFALVAWTGAADACGNETADAKTASACATKCADAAKAKNASVDAKNAANCSEACKAANAVASSACGSKTANAVAGSACGTKTTNAVAGSACNSKATAQVAGAGCGTKTTNAVAGSACGTKTTNAVAGSACGTKTTNAVAGSACNSKATAQVAGAGCSSNAAAKSQCNAQAAKLVSNDPFVNGYMNVQKGLLKGCSSSSAQAASTWRDQVHVIFESEQDSEHAKPLGKLDATLAAWPSDIESQRTVFANVSEWMIGYCEKFPERTAGTKVFSCEKSGHRWVGTEDSEGNPFAG